jgi:hypothetical protein
MINGKPLEIGTEFDATLVVVRPALDGEMIEVEGKLEPLHNLLQNKWWAVLKGTKTPEILCCFDDETRWSKRNSRT